MDAGGLPVLPAAGDKDEAEKIFLLVLELTKPEQVCQRATRRGCVGRWRPPLCAHSSVCCSARACLSGARASHLDAPKAAAAKRVRRRTAAG